MKNSNSHHAFNKASTILALTVITYSVVYAWTGAPAGIPPANNVDAPVNVGVGTQYKSGSLGIGGLLKVYGTFNIPTGAGTGKVLTSDAGGNATWQTSGTGANFPAPSWYEGKRTENCETGMGMVYFYVSSGVLYEYSQAQGGYSYGAGTVKWPDQGTPAIAKPIQVNTSGVIYNSGPIDNSCPWQ